MNRHSSSTLPLGLTKAKFKRKYKGNSVCFLCSLTAVPVCLGSKLRFVLGPDPILSTTISRAPEDIGEAYGAQGPHDIYLSIKPSRSLSKAEEEKLINAVRSTGRVVGGTCKSCLSR